MTGLYKKKIYKIKGPSGNVLGTANVTIGKYYIKFEECNEADSVSIDETPRVHYEPELSTDEQKNLYDDIKLGNPLFANIASEYIKKSKVKK